MDVCECDLVDIWALGKFNDRYVYILFAIDFFFQISTYGTSEVQDRYRSDVSVSVNFQGP